MSAFRSAAADKDARKTIDLRDESGDRVLAGRRTVGRGAITEAVLRRELAHDLGQLLNSLNLESSFDLGPCEHVRRSILNYGLPDVVHRTIDEVSVDSIVGEIARAIAHYEPRLVADSIRVERDAGVDAATLGVRFLVKADMVADPLNIPVEFVAEVQADSGKFAVARL
jgi:type VI secretion system protein ImpF